MYDHAALPSDASSAPGRPAGVTPRQSGSAEPAPDSRIDPIDLLLTLGVAMAVAAAALYRLHPQTIGPGWIMEEGSILAYADRVLEGALPHRDFLTFYGPGNPYLVAAAFEIFGYSVETERAVGLLYRVLVVVALFFVAWRLAGLASGVLAGIVSTAIMAEEGVWAWSTYGAIAFALVGVALAVIAAGVAERSQRWLCLGAGLAAGVAVLMRFDFGPAIVASALPLFLYVHGRNRWWYAGGFLGMAGLYVPYLILVGWDRIARFVGDLRASGEGRTLPVPGPSEQGGTLLVTEVGIAVGFVALGVLLTWRRRDDLAGRILLSAGLFTLGLVPYVLSRADLPHIRPAAIVPLSLLPALALFGMRRLIPDAVGRAVCVAVVGAATIALVYRQSHLETWTVSHPAQIENAGRSFPTAESEHTQTMRDVIADAQRLSRPGESIFVGPLDLRRLNYGPTFIYYLLPKLEPASYYMEMNPGTATRPGSGFADEIRAADWLILTSDWDGWSEPNESSTYGSNEPNEIVRDDFCLRRESGTFRLYERCDRPA